MDLGQLVERTAADARHLAEQARRLEAVAASLERNPVSPTWIGDELGELVARCRNSAADLTVAAQRLAEHAGAAS